MAQKPAKKDAGKTTRKGPAPIPVSTGFWLLKSEPDVFSWDMCKARGEKGEPWTGVRNYLARNNMKAMRLGDLGFFYHSNIGKEIVGIVTVAALAHPDHTDPTGKWGMVDVVPLVAARMPLTLADIKADPALAGMALLRQSRLSVGPVTAAEWKHICARIGVKA